MVTSFHVELEEADGDGEFDDAPRREVPEPSATRLGGYNPLLEVREVTPTDFLKGVFTDCAWVRSLTPLGEDVLVHRAGLVYLSDIGTGFGQKPASLVGRGGPVKARNARGCYQGSLRDSNGLLGATLYQEHLLLPGAMSEVAEAVLRREAELAAREGREPRGMEELQRAHREHPAGR
jgi:hypothetical protein